MNQTIRNAIHDRCVLSFTYDGCFRTVEPHAYGVTPAGHEVIRCYQTGGTSHSGKLPAWRLMKVAQMTFLVVTEQHFVGERPGYKRGDKHMSTIYCEL
jgi:hypothetical protein